MSETLIEYPEQDEDDRGRPSTNDVADVGSYPRIRRRARRFVARFPRCCPLPFPATRGLHGRDDRGRRRSISRVVDRSAPRCANPNWTRDGAIFSSRPASYSIAAQAARRREQVEITITAHCPPGMLIDVGSRLCCTRSLLLLRFSLVRAAN